MGEARRVFRIEQTAAARLDPCVDAAQDGLRHTEIMRELGEIRSALAAAAPRRPRTATARGENARLISELGLIAAAIRGNGRGEGEPQDRHGEVRLPLATARTTHELNAVVDGTEQATQKILAAAERIDVAANNLSAALDGKIEQGMAQDIQDLVIQIFEACNFQDLIGQRIAKIMATLKFIEDHIARVLDEIKVASERNGRPALHGPRLDTDSGHVSQGDVDAMFVSRR